MTNTSAFSESGEMKEKGNLSLARGVFYMLLMVSAWILLLVGFHAITDKMIGR